MPYTFYITPTDYTTAEQNGISARLLTGRVRLHGWNIERAITTPPQKQESRKAWRDIARKNNIPDGAFYKRVIEYGMSLEQASTIPVMDRETIINNIAQAKRKYPKEYEDMAVANGISKKTFVTRMRRGWDPLKAATIPVNTKFRAKENRG